MTNLRVWVWDDDLGVVYADAKTLREAYNIYRTFKKRGHSVLTVGIEMYNAKDDEWEDWVAFLDGVEYRAENLGEYLKKIGE